LDLTQAVTKVELAAAAAEAFSTVDSELFDALCEATKACELAGVSERAIEMTVQHVKTREQFGVPVGGFQAIQQQLADAFAKSQALGALARFAAWAATKSPEQRLLTARSAAVYAAEVAPAVCETAIQCHGGIGFTWEYDLHLYLRRAKLIQTALARSAVRVGELLAAVRS
jgi:alkylation response protein AidB-like acyl-CoA dehydrogenase